MSKQHQPIVSRPQGKDLVEGSKRRLGGLPVNPGGHWAAFLPPDELQSPYGFETEACASFGTVHAVYTLGKQEFGIFDDYSARALAKMSGTTMAGNDPHVVAETLRVKGMPKASEWPYTPDINTFEKFYAEIPQNVINVARVFPATFEFGHQYVVNLTPEKILERLEYSPLGVAVDAWPNPTNGIYERMHPGDDHWCVLYDYVQGQYWMIFDTYEQVHKKLAWDYTFTTVIEYTLHKNVVDERWQAWFVNFFAWFRQLNGFGNAFAFKLGLVGAQLPSLGQLAWGDPIAARHSARVVMDAFNLSWKEKGLLCSVLAEESGFKNWASNKNLRKDGTLRSTDWGIVQCNDMIWIGPNKQFPSVDYVVAHPEEMIAWFVRCYQAGHLDWWCAYKFGAYMKHMPDGIIG